MKWACLGLLLVSLGCSDSDAGLLDFQGIGGDFTLTDEQGQKFSLAEHRGQVYLLFFGFTHCPDVCPTTLVELQEVFQRLGGAGQDLQILFVSVDPERDTPELLASYLQPFDLPVIGLTGTVSQVEKVAQAYGAFFEKVALDSAAVYTMDHSTRSYLIDGEGKVRYIFRYKDEPERIAQIVRKLLP